MFIFSHFIMWWISGDNEMNEFGYCFYVVLHETLFKSTSLRLTNIFSDEAFVVEGPWKKPHSSNFGKDD